MARDAQVAATLVAALIDVSTADQIVLDIPEPNLDGMALAKDIGQTTLFQTARMYAGPIPAIDSSRLFGVATLELG